MEGIAKALGLALDAWRYFTKDEVLIHFGDWTYALSNQWGQETQKYMDLIVQEFADAGLRYEPSKQ